VLIVGTVEPLVGAVRQGAEPQVGRWLASALGLLVAAAVAAPAFVAAGWVLRREQSGQADGVAAMVYRPAALPALAFVGAILKDFPSALAESATWGFLGGLAVLMAGAVLVQRRRGRAWSWWVAVPAGDRDRAGSAARGGRRGPTRPGRRPSGVIGESGRCTTGAVSKSLPLEMTWKSRNRLQGHALRRILAHFQISKYRLG
jgi:hypothetical protein